MSGVAKACCVKSETQHALCVYDFASIIRKKPVPAFLHDALAWIGHCEHGAFGFAAGLTTSAAIAHPAGLWLAPEAVKGGR
jgi:hypothetical protein